MCGSDVAASDVGQGNGCWIVIMAILMGPFSIVMAALIEGKQKNDMAVALKWFTICALVPGIGYLMSCCVACETKKKSGD